MGNVIKNGVLTGERGTLSDVNDTSLDDDEDGEDDGEDGNDGEDEKIDHEEEEAEGEEEQEADEADEVSSEMTGLSDSEDRAGENQPGEASAKVKNPKRRKSMSPDLSSRESHGPQSKKKGINVWTDEEV